MESEQARGARLGETEMASPSFDRSIFVERATTESKLIDAQAITQVLAEHARAVRQAQARANLEYQARVRFFRAGRRRQARF